MAVWVTRSAPDNLRTARALHSIGHKPLLIPVLETRTIPQEAPAQRPDAIVFTSVHAVRHHPFVADHASVPVFAASSHVANAAVEAGYVTVTSTGGDETSLLTMIECGLRPRARVCVFCASRSSTAATDCLRALGHQVERHQVYDPVAVDQGLRDRIGPRLARIDAVTVHSKFAADHLAPLLQSWGWRGRLWCISERAADGLDALVGGSVKVAERPTEVSLMEMIARAPGATIAAAGLPTRRPSPIETLVAGVSPGANENDWWILPS